MLHILWILLKFILTFLGILLGLILLAILLVLFCPVKYRAAVSKEGNSIRTLFAKARVSWLFGAVSFKLEYSTGTTIYDFHLFGIPIIKILQKIRSRKKTPKVSDTQKFSEGHSGPSKPFSEVGTAQTTSGVNTVTDVPDSAFPENAVKSENDDDEENFIFFKNILGTLFYKIGNFCHIIKSNCSFLWKKICTIPSAIENFTLTIQNICAKINAYQKFLEQPRTKAAFSLIKDKFLRILKHVFPTKITGKISFGSTDPSVTGTVLAALGMTMPFHKNCITVIPVFENRNVLTGNINLKGRIYGIIFLKTAIELYFNKNIKYVIRRWKHKED